MFTKTRRAIIAAAVAAGIAGAAFGQDVSYSATATHSLPGQQPSYGTVVKSGHNLRLEFEQDGQRMVQILRPTEGLMYVLYPQTETYLEITGPAAQANTIDGQTSPCPEGDPGMVCQKVGQDKVSGISVEVWSISLQGQNQRMTILWDPTRRQALGQEYPDGTKTRYAFQAMETINGRTTEHWVIRTTAPGQAELTGDWWFDPELRVAVREALPGGEVRSLENVQVGAVDPAMFQVPAGWHKQEMPAMPAVPGGN